MSVYHEQSTNTAATYDLKGNSDSSESIESS